MVKIIGPDYLRKIYASVESFMITNTTNPFSFYNVLSTQNIPSAMSSL